MVGGVSMETITLLKGKEIEKEIILTEGIIDVYINGVLKEEPMPHFRLGSYVHKLIPLKMFLIKNGIREVVKKKNTIKIITNNDHIVEIKPQRKTYLYKEEVISELVELSSKGRLRIKEEIKKRIGLEYIEKTEEYDNDKRIQVRSIDLHEAISILNSLFIVPNETVCFELDDKSIKFRVQLFVEYTIYAEEV